jgi:O-methyltransferase involved in polyketide biosynthesis
MESAQRISDSAFLVNESRARNVALSGDHYAHLWTSTSTSRLWEDFAREVYPLDHIELALRCRFFLERLQAYVGANPDSMFVNIGAGFTSYPFLLDDPVPSVEVDAPHVVSHKRERVERWQANGVLPRRRVEFIGADLADAGDMDRLESRLGALVAGRRSFVLLEGLVYYLDSPVFNRMMDMIERVQCSGSRLALDFWTPRSTANPVYQRFMDFCVRRFGRRDNRCLLFDDVALRSRVGYDLIEQTDIQCLERDLAGTEFLTDWSAILPESYAVLDRC